MTPASTTVGTPNSGKPISGRRRISVVWPFPDRLAARDAGSRPPRAIRRQNACHLGRTACARRRGSADAVVGLAVEEGGQVLRLLRGEIDARHRGAGLDRLRVYQ